jgi:hypothetical protein
MTFNTEALKALLTKVEAATGPDRRLDYEVFTAFATPGGANPWDPNEGHFYTASTDAALELLNRQIAGIIDISFSYESSDAAVWPAATVRWYPMLSDEKGWRAEIGSAVTIPLAICSTVLQFRIAQGGDHA